MKNVLVTGAAGFIGSNYIRHTVSPNWDGELLTARIP